jgi:hypothetical protein
VDFLNARGWDLAFWTVLDEGRVEKAIALIGKSKGKDKWAIEKVRVKKVKGHKGKTDDSEALCRKDGYVYILGSHFGKKKGKDHLREERQFIARFKESGVFAKPDKLTIDELVVSRDEFLLHRLIKKRQSRKSSERHRGSIRVNGGCTVSRRETGRLISRGRCSSKPGRCCWGCAIR